MGITNNNNPIALNCLPVAGSSESSAVLLLSHLQHAQSDTADDTMQHQDEVMHSHQCITAHQSAHPHYMSLLHSAGICNEMQQCHISL